MTKHIPHITRGSCGSSLVCYLLGISQVDPVRYNIQFARFLNVFRDTLPDIDFDFPYNMRDTVFIEIEKKWPGKMARISNHVYYHEKSALREAIRSVGINEFISKNNIHRFISQLPKSKQQAIKSKQKQLMDTFRGYSLHCGGIVFYPEGVPDELKIKDNSLLSQISHNKHDVSQEKRFKIDILSSRGLAQLQDIYQGETIDFDAHPDDEATSQMFAKGDNIGITLAESPLIRKAFIQVQPKNIEEVAICLSLIRPAATEARAFDDIEKMKHSLVFDDDAINILSEILQCDKDVADKYRRAINKSKLSVSKELSKHQSLNSFQKQALEKRLKYVKQYGFCKSHAYSYAQLVWQLAYTKAHFPKRFWKSTLRHCKSHYKPWVHLYEAKCHGVDKLGSGTKSIYSQNRNKDFTEMDNHHQMIKCGYWHMTDSSFYPGCCFEKQGDIYNFKGLVASSRVIKIDKLKRKMVVFLGIGTQQYIELHLQSPIMFKIGLQGTGKLIDGRFNSIDVSECKSF
jgi:DNA polymerase III alpha subunit